jgi:hypothetical protein
MKHLTFIFYAGNGDVAKAAATKIRTAGRSAQLRDAIAYGGEVEPCDSVAILSSVSAFDRARIEAAYGDKVQRAAATEKSKLTLPPAPAIEPPPAPTPKGR